MTARASALPMFAAAWVVTAVFILSNSATPPYVHWQSGIGFSSAMLTAIFAAYVLGLLLTLMVAGQLSDRFGRRSVLLPGQALMTTYHSYDPREGHRLAHSPIKAIIAPRPIGWISTIGLDGVANLAPYSFFNIVSEKPPVLLFSSEGRKDTIRNIEATGEFVFNLATRTLAEAMNVTSADWPPERALARGSAVRNSSPVAASSRSLATSCRTYLRGRCGLICNLQRIRNLAA